MSIYLEMESCEQTEFPLRYITALNNEYWALKSLPVRLSVCLSVPVLCCLCSYCGTVRVTGPGPALRQRTDSHTWAVFPSAMNFSPICQSPRNMLPALTSSSPHVGHCEEKEGFNNCRRRQQAAVGAKFWSQERAQSKLGTLRCSGFIQRHM